MYNGDGWTYLPEYRRELREAVGSCVAASIGGNVWAPSLYTPAVPGNTGLNVSYGL